MTATDKPEVSFANLSLAPMDDDVLRIAPTAPVKFHGNTRSKTERRQASERRQVIRFEADRRSGNNRRPKASWEPGSNL